MADVGVIMGSDSDWPVMKAAAGALSEFGVQQRRVPQDEQLLPAR